MHEKVWCYLSSLSIQTGVLAVTFRKTLMSRKIITVKTRHPAAPTATQSRREPSGAVEGRHKPWRGEESRWWTTFMFPLALVAASSSRRLPFTRQSTEHSLHIAIAEVASRSARLQSVSILAPRPSRFSCAIDSPEIAPSGAP